MDPATKPFLHTISTCLRLVANDAGNGCVLFSVVVRFVFVFLVWVGYCFMCLFIYFGGWGIVVVLYKPVGLKSSLFASSLYTPSKVY